MRGAEARRSGRVNLPLGDTETYAPTKWRGLCNVFGDDGKPIARTVRVNVSLSENESDQLSNVRFPSGVWWTFGTSVPWVRGGDFMQVNGALRFRFGSQGVSRTLICDLASGDYQIPSCEHLYVEATRYAPGSNLFGMGELGYDRETEVQGEITDGTSPDFSPMIVTAPTPWGSEHPPDVAATIAVPPGAYAFDLYPDAITGAENVFEISPPGARRDFANGVLQPQGPLPIVSNTIRVQTRGELAYGARMVFFVR